MRRPVAAAMSGVSVVVLGVAVHASQRAAPAVAQAGVAQAGVTQADAPDSPSPFPSVPQAGRTQVPTRTASTRPTAPRAPSTVAVNGVVVDTQYGPVQVQATLRRGHVVRAAALAYPQAGRRDQEINSQAVPVLDAEAVRADSAQIDAVSGATYTSEGYRRSLQSALDAAHRAGAR